VKHAPLYECVAESAMSSGTILMLRMRGFKFHHFRATEDQSNDRTEYVHYLWPSTENLDPVPQYATSIEGAACIILSPGPEGPDTKVLGVWERGCWSMPGGAVHMRERTFDALVREVKEEVGVTLDADFPPRYLGGWQEARARDDKISDNFSIFIVKASSEAVRVDNVEVEQAVWLPAGLNGAPGLVTAWERAGKPSGKRVEIDFGQWGNTTMPAAQQKVRTRLIKGLDALMNGKYLPTKSEKQKLEFGYVL